MTKFKLIIGGTVARNLAKVMERPRNVLMSCRLSLLRSVRPGFVSKTVSSYRKKTHFATLFFFPARMVLFCHRGDLANFKKVINWHEGVDTVEIRFCITLCFINSKTV